MSLNRKILIVSTLIGALLISSFVLIWGKNINNKDLVLSILMFIEIVLVILLSLNLIKNK